MIDWFRTATPARQLQLSVAAACLFAVFIAVVWFAFLRTTYLPLFSGLRATDAASIVSVLERKKVPYRLADGGATILVPEEMVDATRLGVMGEDVPLKGTVGFELFNKTDMGITDFAQKINYQRALQGELERTIMTLDGVDTARVHLSLGEDRLFRDDRVPPKASVTIRMAKNASLSQEAAQGVKRLVAAAVPNLDVANVVILDAEGDVVSGLTAAPVTASPPAAEARAIEEYYAARIRDALDHAGLPANIGVLVQADAAVPEPSLAGWSPAVRDFPLQVTLSPAAPLEPAAQESVRMTVAAAIASTTAQSDMISFGIAVAPAVAPALIAAHGVPAPPVRVPVADLAPPAAEHDVLPESGLALLAVIGAFAGVMALARTLRGPRRLSERRRADFVAKLKTVLDKGDGRAASQT